MGGLFGGGGGDGGAAARQIEQQREQLAKQEAELNAQKTEAAQKAQASMMARRRGGLAQLLSTEREDAATGIQTTTKLGAGPMTGG